MWLGGRLEAARLTFEFPLTRQATALELRLHGFATRAGHSKRELTRIL